MSIYSVDLCPFWRPIYTKKGVKWHLAIRLPEITIVDGIPVKEGEQPLETFEYGPFSNTDIVRLVELGGQWKLMIKCSEIDGELEISGTTIAEVAPGIYYLPIMRDEPYENTIFQVLGLEPIHKNADTSTIEEEEEGLRRVLELVDTTK